MSGYYDPAPDADMEDCQSPYCAILLALVPAGLQTSQVTSRERDPGLWAGIVQLLFQQYKLILRDLGLQTLEGSQFQKAKLQLSETTLHCLGVAVVQTSSGQQDLPPGEVGCGRTGGEQESALRTTDRWYRGCGAGRPGASTSSVG